MKQNNFFARIHKTLKINIDDNSHRLPPSLGEFPEYKVADYDCPPEWSKDGIFIPVNEGDPMWFDFTQNDDECAIIVAVQKVNPITGERVELKLTKDPKQNYLKMPEQRWLDGYSNDGKVYQFVVTKAGLMTAVNEYVLPIHEQDSYAIGFAFFGLKNPKPKTIPQYYPQYSNGFYSSLYKISNTCRRLTEIPSIGQSEFAGASYNSVSPEDRVTCFFDGEVKTSGVLGPIGQQGDVVDGITERTQHQLTPEVSDIDHTTFEKASMGQGGRIVQEIFTDPNTIEYYTTEPAITMNYYLCLPEQFKVIMDKGRKSDPYRKDKFVHSGKVGSEGVQIPLI